MSAADKILEELKTPEGQAKIKKYIENFLEKEKIKKNKSKEMLSNPNYMNWLDNFTLKRQGFSDDDWLYNSDGLTVNDKENVNNLYLIYNGIDEYARRNYVYPFPCDFGNFYKIKFNDIGFEIGVQRGQGVRFFCNRVLIENVEEFIDFNDISCDKKYDNVDKISNQLNELSNYVVFLHESGVPFQAMVNALDETLEQIRSEEKTNNVKVLKK